MSEKENSILKDNTYNIWIEAYSGKELVDRQVSLHTSKSGFNLFFEVFHIIKNALLRVNIDSEKSEFENISELLFHRFDLKDLNNQGSIELAITDYINDLKYFEFYVPDRLSKKEFSKEGIKWIGKYFKNTLRSLREEKIRFWEEVLKDYLKIKKDYDVEFQTKCKLREMELDRISRITPDDINHGRI